MKILKIGIFLILIVFIGIQFFPTKRNQSIGLSNSDISYVYNVPDKILTILKSSCYDCHSNNTEYPWYNRIQPISWILENHIKEAKKELNFSEFASYSRRRQKSKLKSIANRIEDGEMPLYSYTLIHRDAIISDSEKLIIRKWINSLLDSL